MHLCHDAILVRVHCRLHGEGCFFPDKRGFSFDRRDIRDPTGTLGDRKKSEGEPVRGSVGVNVVPDLIDCRADVERSGWSLGKEESKTCNGDH